MHVLALRFEEAFKRGVAMEDNIRISSSVVSHVGSESQLNRDSFFANGKFMYHRRDSDVQISLENSEDMQVYAVCKGMVSGSDGDKSSISFNNELKRFLEKNKDGRKPAEELFEKLCELSDEAGSLIRSMSDEDYISNETPVMAGLLVKGSEAGVLSLGDTRIFRLRNGSLKQLTADNRRTERLLRLGIITDEQAEAVSGRLGDSVDGEIDKIKRTEIFALSRGDVYLLSNSGLLDYIDEDALFYILSMDEDTSTIAGTLMDEVLKRRSDESITIQVIKVDSLAGDVIRPEAVSASAVGSAARYSPRRPVKISRSASSKVKIKRAARLIISTILIFALVIGLFWLIQILLFPPRDREASADPTETTTITGTRPEETEEEGTETTEETNVPVETTEPTDQGSSSTSVPENGRTIYEVKSGDTLMNIARHFYNDASKYTLIMEANNISDPDHIIVGQKLIIPEVD